MCKPDANEKVDVYFFDIPGTDDDGSFQTYRASQLAPLADMLEAWGDWPSKRN